MSEWTCQVRFVLSSSLESLTSIFFQLTDQQIGTLLFRDIQYAFFDFLDNILTSCQLNPSVGRIPISWQQPIYGDRIPNFTDFAAPGVQLT